jgi:Cu+-exporting ATPase
MFSKNVDRKHKTITDTVSRYFTPLLAIAFIGFGYWLPINSTAFNVFTAVLIVACPCALP